jgi:arginyl-tRNA synthetase
VPDPRQSLRPRFKEAVARAFGPEYEDVDPVLRRSQHERFGDYQANVAMSLARRVGASPREVAGAILDHLDVDEMCSKVEVAGPGFINLTMRAERLAAELTAVAGHPRLGLRTVSEPETVVVDYSAPNVAKEMQVQHLRSTIIGDAVVRILEWLGHRVIRQNHMGDWGTPFGMLIEHLLDLGETQSADELSLGDLTDFYRQAQAKFSSDPGFAERARRRVVALQGGDEATLALWRILVEESTRYFQSVYERLGVTLTGAHIKAESFYNPSLDEVAVELEAKGLARMDQGALCAFPTGFAGRDGEPLPLIIRKSDGGYGYAATDLAAIRHRTVDLQATRIVYVVGAPQAQHLAMVFAVAEQAGWLSPPARAEHVAFGSVLGRDGRMLRTRSGEAIKLIDLLDEAVERAAAVVAEKSPDLEVVARADVAKAVGIGAVKYADLSNDRVKDYVFDWERMLAMDGNTAPYLQYAHARVRSIFRRAAGADVTAAGVEFIIGQPEERELALQLLSLEDAVQTMAEVLQPHRLCTYLFELASAFTAFYERCPVLRAETDAQRRSRLALCDLTARTLKTGLGLLGIEVPDRM